MRITKYTMAIAISTTALMAAFTAQRTLGVPLDVPGVLEVSEEDRNQLTLYLRELPETYENIGDPAALREKAEQLRIERNHEEALKCYEVLANLGDSEGQMDAARYYMGWDIGRINVNRSALWLSHLTNNPPGNLSRTEFKTRYRACLDLGKFYEQGTLGRKNHGKALELYKLAHELKVRSGSVGSVTALYSAGRMQELLAIRSQRPEDKTEAFNLYYHAYEVCRQDDRGMNADIPFILARKLELGYGVDRNMEGAIEFYQVAHAAGSSHALGRLMTINRSDGGFLEGAIDAEVEDALDQRMQQTDRYFLYNEADLATGLNEPNYPDPQDRFFSALSIDGGGIRGFMPALLLEELERSTNRRAYQLFDYMGGTSVGGIISLGLTFPDRNDENHQPYRAEELKRIFSERGREIFKPGNWFTRKVWNIFHSRHNPSGLNTVLQEFFGDAEFHNARIPVLVTSYENRRRAPHVFNSLDASRSLRSNYKVVQVGRATSAAPSFFPVYQCRNFAGENNEFLDGGIYVNNPSRLVWEALRSHTRNLSDGGPDQEATPKNTYLLSLGTGDIGEPAERFSSGWWNGKLSVAAPAIDVLMWAQSYEVDNVMKGFLRNHYWRIQPKLNEPWELDDTKHFAEMEELVEPFKEKIERYGEKLLRRER